VSVAKIVGAGILLAFGLASWGGIQFFILPIGLFFVALPFMRKDNKFIIWTSVIFTSVFLLVTISFELLKMFGLPVTTGGFTTGEVYQGVGAAKSNGNISAVGSATPTYSSALTADRHGVVGGELTIPATTFRAGEKLFRLTDSSTDTVASTESVAEKVFRVQGLLESRSGRISSTRPMESKRENVKEKNTTQDTINRISTSTNWINPLSQTFLVDRNENPNGVYASSIDVFFSAVDATLPVTLQLRPVVNEFPSSSAILPFSEVILNASETTANSTAPSAATSSTFTRFTFESPVYLYPDEYAVVLTSSS